MATQPKPKDKETTTKVEPKKDEPTKVDPKKDEPTKVDPKKDEPTKVDPEKDEPTKVDPKKDEPTKVDPPKAEKKNPYKELAARYAKTYPDNKVFHITTDMQVFLEKNKSAAINHQKTLKEGQVQTINIQ